LFALLVNAISLVCQKEGKKNDKQKPSDKSIGLTKLFFVFWVVGLAQVCAGFLGNKAQEYVDTTAKTLIKSMKPVSFMIVSFFCGGARFSKTRSVGVLILSAGISFFMIDMETHGSSQEKYTSGIGILLSITALFMDGLVGSSQDGVKKKHDVSPDVMMLMVNVWGLFYALIPLLYFGELITAYNFIQRFPEIGIQLVLYSIASPIGNYFIFLMISNFGSLKCSIVTTSRKFLTIIVNTLGYHRILSMNQIYSIVGVFFGIVLEQYGEYREKEKKKN